MKKTVCALLVLFLLCGCGGTIEKPQKKEAKKFIGVWISCYELNNMLDSGNFEGEFSAAAEKLKEINASDAFVHVRAFGESLFDSRIYPMAENVKQYDYDVLSFMIETLKNNGINFHAWINPFRKADGTFNNPADTSVKSAVIGGIREILGKYPVAGVHFDDYFYEAGENSVDSDTYAEYLSTAESPLTLEEYRRSVINSFIFAARDAVKAKNSDLVFSVSPAASIEKNTYTSFADVSFWCSSGAVDMIIPQLYFGYKYPDKNYAFTNLLSQWESLDYADNVKLIIGLAAYKTGTEKEPDNIEWQSAKVLSRQTKDCLLSSKVSGVCFFSYSYLFGGDELHLNALNTTKEQIEKYA